MDISNERGAGRNQPAVRELYLGHWRTGEPGNWRTEERIRDSSRPAGRGAVRGDLPPDSVGPRARMELRKPRGAGAAGPRDERCWPGGTSFTVGLRARR